MGHDGSKALVAAEASGAGVEGFGGGGGYFHPLTLKASGNAEGGPPALSFRRNTYGLGIPPFALLHKCSASEWNEERASIAGFAEKIFTCEGHIYKDCSPDFCMSRQGIIDINKGSSIFSFRRRTKFSKMAAHFEYHHIPAQLSTIQKFHVKGVLCFYDNLVVVHLVKLASQFGLLDLKVNKFKGLFGQQMMEFQNESLMGQISPDKRFVVIKIPCQEESLDRNGAAGGLAGFTGREFLVYDLDTKTLIQRIKLNSISSRFCFDPRFASSRLAISNFHADSDSSLSLVSRTIPATTSVSFPTSVGLNSRFSSACRASSFSSSSLSSLSSASSHQSSSTEWHEILEASRCHPAGMNFQDHLQDLVYTKNGSLIIGSLADTVCHCKSSKSSRLLKAIDVNYFIAHGDSGELLHVIRTQRFTCVLHLCPVNYTPILSNCSSRMAVATTYGAHTSSVSNVLPSTYVCVHHLPTLPSLQNMCRTIILQHVPPNRVSLLPLPNKILEFLSYKPEFDYKHH